MPPMEGKKSAWGKPAPNPAVANPAFAPKRDNIPIRPATGSGPMHQPPAPVSGPDGNKGPRPVVGGYARKPEGVPLRRKDISPGQDGFVEELYTTRLDPEKLSEQQRKEAARIAAEIEEERNRKAGGRGAGPFPGARPPGPRKFNNWADDEDDDLEDATNDAPPPPVHSVTAFPALDSRPRDAAPGQEGQQSTNNGPSAVPPAVSNPSLAPKQFPPTGQSMQPAPAQEYAGNNATNLPKSAPNNADGSNAEAAGQTAEPSMAPQPNNNSSTGNNNSAAPTRSVPAGMPPLMPVPGHPPLPSSAANALSQLGLPMFRDGGAAPETAGQGEQGGDKAEEGSGGPGQGAAPPNVDASRSGPFPPLTGEALSLYLEHPENSALHAFIAQDYQFKVSMRQEAAVVQERLKESERARESAERLVKQLEREKSALAQEKSALEKQLDVQSAKESNGTGNGGNQHLLETVEKLREELAHAREKLHSSEDRERQVYHLLEREKMQVQSVLHHRESSFFQMLHQQETRIQQQEARIQDLQRHNLHLSNQIQGDADPSNKGPPPPEGSGAPGGAIDPGAPPGMSSLGMGGMAGGFNLHQNRQQSQAGLMGLRAVQMSMQMQQMQRHHHPNIHMQMPPGQMMGPNAMPPPLPPMQQQPPAPNHQPPPPAQPPLPQPMQGQPPKQGGNDNGVASSKEPEKGSNAPPAGQPSMPPQGQQQGAEAAQPYYGGSEGVPMPGGGNVGWQGRAGAQPAQGDGEGGKGPWPMGAGMSEEGAKQQQQQQQQQQQPAPGGRGGGAAVGQQAQGPTQKGGPGGGGPRDAEALIQRKRELLSLKKTCGHHEFFDLDNMTSQQVEAAIKRIQEQYGQGGGRGVGRQPRGGEQGRGPQNVPGEEWEVVQPTKKGQQGNRMVDEKRVVTFTLQDKSGMISGNLLQGLMLYHNVLQVQEEQALIEFAMDQLARGKRRELAGTTFVPAQRNGKRCAQLQYGIAYNYAEQTVGGQVEPLPAILLQLAEKLVAEGIITHQQRPNTAVVALYEDGEGLPPHVETKDFARPICTLSLSNPVDMCFGDKAGRIDVHPGGMDGFLVNLPRRSALVMQDGLCANDVQHAVGPVKGRWMSVTLRKH